MITLEAPRVTTGWRLGGTNTFRKSSGKLLDHWGVNLQNPSKRFCKLCVADKDKKLIQADQAGAEALIVAYLVPDGNYRQLFLNKIKPHTFVAMHLFADTWSKELKEDITPYLKSTVKDLKTLPKWKELAELIKTYSEGKYYFIGKKSCHSFNYRKAANTFIFDVLKESEGRVVLSKEEGQRIHSIYHNLFPEISQEWWPHIDSTLRETRTLYNLFGYPRYFGGAFSDKFFREATSFVPQSTVGCITSKAFVYLQNEIETKIELKGVDLLNDKHDAILLQCYHGTEITIAKILKHSLEQELISPFGEKFQMKTEVFIGTNWGNYDKEKNPEGMQEIVL